MTTTKIHCKPKLKAALKPTKPNLFEWWLFRYVRYSALANDSSISFLIQFFFGYFDYLPIFSLIYMRRNLIMEFNFLRSNSAVKSEKSMQTTRFYCDNPNLFHWYEKKKWAFIVAQPFSIYSKHVFQVRNLRAINFEIQRRYKIKCSTILTLKMNAWWSFFAHHNSIFFFVLFEFLETILLWRFHIKWNGTWN